jgi:hypothetical protein
MKAINRREDRERFFLLSIPDLIRHPGVEGNPPQSPFAKGGDERRRLDTARF